MSLPASVLVLVDDHADRSWLDSALEQLRSGGINEVSWRSQADGLLPAGSGDYEAVIVDSSLGYERTMDALHGIMANPEIIPVLLCLDGDEREDFADAILYGAQEIILRGHDPVDVVERLLVHSVQRARILKATADAESRARVIIEGISDGVLIVDEAGTILFANPASERLLDKPLIELMGAPLDLEIPEESEAVVEVPLSSGDAHILSVRWVPVRWEGRDVRLYTMQDVTEKQQIREQLSSASEIAERLKAMKSSFMANMSHELRLPLASIIGFGQLIEADETDPDLKEFAGSIVESGTKLLDTVNAILDLTRLDAREFELARNPVSIGDTAGEVLRDLEKQATEKGLQVDLRSVGEGTVKADVDAIRRILSSVIGNAVKFTEEGFVAVTVTTTQDAVTCEVTDTGIGIDPGFIEQAFDDFTQESAGAARAYNGSGLGLAVSRRLLNAMGGSVSVTSVKGEGSTFLLTFPVTPPSS